MPLEVTSSLGTPRKVSKKEIKKTETDIPKVRKLPNEQPIDNWNWEFKRQTHIMSQN